MVFEAKSHDTSLILLRDIYILQFCLPFLRTDLVCFLLIYRSYRYNNRTTTTDIMERSCFIRTAFGALEPKVNEVREVTVGPKAGQWAIVIDPPLTGPPSLTFFVAEKPTEAEVKRHVGVASCMWRDACYMVGREVDE